MSSSSSGGGQGGVVIALVVNLLMAWFKFVTAGISRSTAMLAEAVHSPADNDNQVFLLTGMRRSVRPSDARYSFGSGTEVHFWAFVIAGSIPIGAVVNIWEGVEMLGQIHQGTHRDHADVRWALLVLGVSVALELLSLRAALVELGHLPGGRGLRRALEAARDPTVLTVLFEDVAAPFGLVAALCGVLLTHLTGQPIWDAPASMVVGVALAVVAVVLGRDSKSLLIGEAIHADEHRQNAEMAAWSDVLARVHLRTLHTKFRRVLAALKLRFRWKLTIDSLEQSISGLEAALRGAFPHLRCIYIEPGFDKRAPRHGQGESP